MSNKRQTLVGLISGLLLLGAVFLVVDALQAVREAVSVGRWGGGCITYERTINGNTHTETDCLKAE